MTGPRFTFRHVWTLPATPGDTFAALADVERYPQWWPQVRAAERLDDSSGMARVRSLLPWSLRLELTRDVVDPATGTLRVRLDGDLRGWCQWVVRPRGAGSRATFTQQVELTVPYAAGLAVLARPVLVANHSWMMARGERGLRAFLVRGMG